MAFVAGRLRHRFVAYYVLCTALASVAQPTRPHLLWIVADDLGWHDVGFMNGEEIHTPAIDRIARKGRVLTNYYVQPSCSPTRATFLTGRYPLRHGINSFIPKGAKFGLPLNETTVAELLLRDGYRTRAIGKWHLGSVTYYHTPTFRGFESFFGYYGGGQDYFTHSSGGAFDFRRDEGLRCGRNCSRFATDAYGKYSTSLFAEEAVRLVKEHDTNTPLFMYFAPQAVHSPLQVPQSFVTPYASTIPDHSRRLYAGMVSALDLAIEDILKALNEKDMLENTFVIFTTDNGGPSEACGVTPASNFPLRGSKCSVWDGGTRGIAAIMGPGVKGSGTEWSGLMHAADWLPTIMSMVGSKSPSRSGFPLDGMDMWPAWSQGHMKSPRSNVYYGVTDSQVGFHGPAYREGDMKIIIDREGGGKGLHLEAPAQLWAWQTQLVGADTEDEMLLRRTPADGHFPLLRSGHSLYNLTSDPDEEEDLADKHPDMATQMLDRVKQLTAVYACMDCEEYSGCPDEVSMRVDIQLPSGPAKGAEPFCDKMFDEEHEAKLLAARLASDKEKDEALAASRNETLDATQAARNFSGSAASNQITEKWEAIDGEVTDDDDVGIVADDIIAEAMGEADLPYHASAEVVEGEAAVPLLGNSEAAESSAPSAGTLGTRNAETRKREGHSETDRHGDHSRHAARQDQQERRERRQHGKISKDGKNHESGDRAAARRHDRPGIEPDGDRQKPGRLRRVGRWLHR